MVKRSFIVFVLILAALPFGMSVTAQESEFTARVIEVASQAPLARLSPDGSLIVVYHEPILHNFEPQDRYAWLINVATGEEIATIAATDYISDAAFNPGGSVLALAQTNGDIHIYDVESQAILKTFELPFYGGVRPLEFSPDGCRLMFMANGTTGQIIFMDIETGYIVEILAPHFATRQEFSDSISDAMGRTAFTYVTADLAPDGKTVAVATGNDAVFLWDVETGRQLMLRLESERKAMFGVSDLAYTADGSALVYTMPRDSVVSVRDGESGTETDALAITADTFALTPDGASIAWINREEAALYFAALDQTDSPEMLFEPLSDLSIAPRVTTLQFSEDGQTLLLSGLFNREGTANTIYLFERGG